MTIRELVAAAKNEAWVVCQRRENLTPQQRLGEFITQLRRLSGALRQNGRLAEADYNRIYAMFPTEKWLEPGVPKHFFRHPDFCVEESTVLAMPPTITETVVGLSGAADAIRTITLAGQHMEGLVTKGRAILDGMTKLEEDLRV